MFVHPAVSLSQSTLPAHIAALSQLLLCLRGESSHCISEAVTPPASHASLDWAAHGHCLFIGKIDMQCAHQATPGLIWMGHTCH